MVLATVGLTQGNTALDRRRMQNLDKSIRRGSKIGMPRQLPILLLSLNGLSAAQAHVNHVSLFASLLNRETLRITHASQLSLERLL
jgi:hypothetical protein